MQYNQSREEILYANEFKYFVLNLQSFLILEMWVEITLRLMNWIQRILLQWGIGSRSMDEI